MYAVGKGLAGVHVSGPTLVHLEQVRTSAIFDPFGPVDDGHIKLKGILCKARMAFDSRKQIELVVISGSSLVIDNYTFDLQHLRVSIDRYPPFPEFIYGEHVECFLLPLFQAQGTHRNGQPWEHLIGLVLRPTVTKKGQFTRMGQIAIQSTEARDAIKVAISEQVIEDQFFEELDQRRGYLIEII